jgi:hypothetical protein
MSAPAHSEDVHEQPHDQAAEIAHAREHMYENNKFFLGMFLPVILITVVLFYIDFGKWNPVVTWTAAAIRSGCIAYFLAHLFKQFSFVFRTLIFTFIFLLGMIFLSLWDSELRGIGNPIHDNMHPESEKI